MVGALIPWLSVVLPTMLGAFGSFQFVREGERAILLRFNKAVKKDGRYVVVTPGIKWVVPFADKLARTHMLDRTITVPAQEIQTTDGEVFYIGAVILCHVKDSRRDLYRALFMTENVNDSLIEIGKTVIQNVMATKSADDLNNGQSQEAIAQELRQGLQQQAKKWGVKITWMRLAERSPTQTTQLVGAMREVMAPVVATFANMLRVSPAVQPDTSRNGHVTPLHSGNGHVR